MSDKDAPETVELAPEALDAIAERIAGLMQASPETPVEDPQIKELRDEVAALKASAQKPVRTDLGDGDGPAPKPGEAKSVFTGGDDIYTYAGDTPAEIATNLWLTQEIVEGLGKKGHQQLSPRAKQVMLAAAEVALKGAPTPIVSKGNARDGDAFVKSSYGMYRAEARKAMTSTASGSGDEWVPTFATSELWRDIHLATTIAAQFQRVDMPTNPYDLPTETADIAFKYASTENVAVTATNPTTAKASLTAKKIQAEVDFSGEVTEDSIIPIVPTLRADLVRKGGQTIDDLIVHGDTETGGTGNVNSDDAAPGAGSYYLALDGLRKFSIVTNTGQLHNVSAAPTAALINTTRGLLGKYGAFPSDLLIATGTATYLAFLTIAEVLTQEKYGASATILRGELARIFNVPIFLSEAIPLAATDKVDSDGKYTTTSPSSNDTKGWYTIVNTRLWKTGFRRDFQIESFRDIQKDQNILVASFRMALTSGGHATTHTASAKGVTV